MSELQTTYVLVEKDDLVSIADTIRSLNDTTDKMSVHDISAIFSDISSNTMEGQEIYPSKNDVVIPANTFTKGEVVIKGDEALVPSNIADGVTIYGVTGTRPHALDGLTISTYTNVDTGTITATQGDQSVSGTLANGEVYIEVPTEGTWTISGTSGSRNADTTTATLKAADTVKVVFFEATVGCYIMGDVSTTVTCTNGTTTYTSTGGGEQYFTVYERGTWTVSCEIDGATWSQSFNVQEHKKKYIEIFNGEPDSVLNNNSWTLISTIASTGLAANYWSIGDTKEVVLNGTAGATTYDNVSVWAQIIGFNHNPEYEGESSIHFQIGTTAQASGTQIALIDSMHGLSTYSTGYFTMNNQGSNTGGWETSKMRTVMLPALETIMPTDLIAVIKTVNKYTDNVGGGKGHVETNVTMIEDRLFLPSYYEVFGGTSTSYTNSYENDLTTQYAYYSAGNSKIRYRHSTTRSTCYWWLRSPSCSFSNSFVAVDTFGSANNYYANNSYGCAPCFAL